MIFSHLFKAQFGTFLLLLIKSSPSTALAVPRECQEEFDLDLIDDDEELFGRFEFSCVGCCGYNETIDKTKIEEVIMEYLNEEFTCQGGGEEGEVLYVSLDTWVEGLECSERQLEIHGGALRQQQRRLESRGGSNYNYSSCKNCKKKKKKKSQRRHLDLLNKETKINGVKNKDKEAFSLLAKTGFRSLQKQEGPNTIQPIDDIARMTKVLKGSQSKPKAPQTKEFTPKELKTKGQKSKSPKTKGQKSKSPKSKAFKKSSGSIHSSEECIVFPPSCQRSMRRKVRNLQLLDITSLLEKLHPIFPEATEATPVSNTLDKCAFGTSACSSSIGTCCGAIGCECNTPSDSLCELEECCIYQESTFDIDFCASISDCETKQCFEPPSPSDDCDGNTTPPQCCFGINDEPLSPDFCSGVNGCSEDLGYCVSEEFLNLQLSREPSRAPSPNFLSPNFLSPNFLIEDVLNF